MTSIGNSRWYSARAATRPATYRGRKRLRAERPGQWPEVYLDFGAGGAASRRGVGPCSWQLADRPCGRGKESRLGSRSSQSSLYMHTLTMYEYHNSFGLSLQRTMRKASNARGKAQSYALHLPSTKAAATFAMVELTQTAMRSTFRQSRRHGHWQSLFR